MIDIRMIVPERSAIRADARSSSALHWAKRTPDNSNFAAVTQDASSKMQSRRHPGVLYLQFRGSHLGRQFAAYSFHGSHLGLQFRGNARKEHAAADRHFAGCKMHARVRPVEGLAMSRHVGEPILFNKWWADICEALCHYSQLELWIATSWTYESCLAQFLPAIMRIFSRLCTSCLGVCDHVMFRELRRVGILGKYYEQRCKIGGSNPNYVKQHLSCSAEGALTFASCLGFAKGRRFGTIM